MKKLRLLLLAIIMILPFYTVNAAELMGYLPDTIETNEGVVFTKSDNTYIASLNSLNNELNFNLSIEGLQIDGVNKIICEESVTKQSFRVYKLDSTDQVCTPNTCDYETVTFIVNRMNPEGDSSLLKDLKISGASFVFDSSSTSLSVTVPSSTEEVYIYTETFGPTTTVEGDGFVKLTGPSTKVTLTTKNELLGDVEYNIVINRGMGNAIYIIIIVILAIALIGYIAFNAMNKKVTVKTVNPEFTDDTVNKGIVINTTKPIPVEETKEEPTVETPAEAPAEAAPIEETPAPVTEEVQTPEIPEEDISKPQTLDLNTTVKPIPVEEVSEEVKEETKEEVKEESNEVDPIINNNILSSGIEPRTMIVTDDEK